MEDHNVPQLLPLGSFADARGRLGVIEGATLPFQIERVYFLYDVPIGAIRGEHGHKRLQQILLCMSGACDVSLFDGSAEYLFHLNDPATALYLPAGIWRSLKFKEAGTVVSVLASRRYEPADYIHSFEDYLRWIEGGRIL